MRQKRVFITAVGVAFLAAGCMQNSQKPAEPVAPDTRAQDEAAVRAGDANFAQWAASKDVDKIVALYEDDAVAFAPGMPALTGKDSIRKMIAGLVSRRRACRSTCTWRV